MNVKLSLFFICSLSFKVRRVLTFKTLSIYSCRVKCQIPSNKSSPKEWSIICVKSIASVLRNLEYSITIYYFKVKSTLEILNVKFWESLSLMYGFNDGIFAVTVIGSVMPHPNVNNMNWYILKKSVFFYIYLPSIHPAIYDWVVHGIGHG